MDFLIVGFLFIIFSIVLPGIIEWYASGLNIMADPDTATYITKLSLLFGVLAILKGYYNIFIKPNKKKH